MQLFDLMNNLISLNNNLRKKNLEVIRTNIIPMTNGLPNVHGGLIEWIQNSDTINTLLDVVRNRFNVHRDLEKRAEGTGLMISVMDPWTVPLSRSQWDVQALEAWVFFLIRLKGYRRPDVLSNDSLTILQKIQQFQYVQHTTKDAAYYLAKSLWLGSPNAEVNLAQKFEFLPIFRFGLIKEPISPDRLP